MGGGLRKGAGRTGRRRRPAGRALRSTSTQSVPSPAPCVCVPGARCVYAFGPSARTPRPRQGEKRDPTSKLEFRGPERLEDSRWIPAFTGMTLLSRSLSSRARIASRAGGAGARNDTNRGGRPTPAATRLPRRLRRRCKARRVRLCDPPGRRKPAARRGPDILPRVVHGSCTRRDRRARLRDRPCKRTRTPRGARRMPRRTGVARGSAHCRRGAQPRAFAAAPVRGPRRDPLPGRGHP